MIPFLTTLHVTVCVFLVIIVLLQHGKGADIGATFGGGSQTVFGARGAATFLHKMTAVMAVTFMVTSVSLAYLSAQESRSSVVAPTATEETETSAEEKAAAPAEKKAKEDPAPQTKAE